MRTITSLLRHDGRIYVYLAGRNVAHLFLQNAEAEGFTFIDGARPTAREADDLFALNPDFTLNHVGYVGHVAFKCAKAVGDQPLIKVDYARFLSGSDAYVMA